MQSNQDPLPSQEDAEKNPTDVDRYPELADVLDWVLESAEIPQGPIERLEVTCLANGDAACRVWPARSEEPVGIVMLTELQ